MTGADEDLEEVRGQGAAGESDGGCGPAGRTRAAGEQSDARLGVGVKAQYARERCTMDIPFTPSSPANSALHHDGLARSCSAG